MTADDLDHRLWVLYAWREWSTVATSDLRLGATYRAVLDGCGIKIRSLCLVMKISADFRRFQVSAFPISGTKRTAKLLTYGSPNCRSLKNILGQEELRCFIEVL